MASIEVAAIGLNVVSMVVTFIIITIIAYISLWALDKGTPKIPFEKIQDDPKAVAIASIGWILFYALAFAGSLIAPFSLNPSIIWEILWTIFIVMVPCELILFFILFLSPFLRYCGLDGLNYIGKDSISIAIFYLGLCILIGFLSYTALTTRIMAIG